MRRSQSRAGLLAAGLLLFTAACSSTESSGDATAEAEANDVDVNGGAAAVAVTESAADLGVATLGAPAPNFTLTDTNGTTHSLADFQGRTVVLEWVNHGCPFVKKHYDSDNMQALQARYTDQDVVWLSICSSAPGKQGHMSSDDWNAKTADLGAAPTAVLIDEDGAVGKQYLAKTTPHMYVIDAEGQLVYNGAIDDDRSANPNAAATANNYVAQTLDAMLAGEAVEPFGNRSYGCGVKYAN